MTKKRRRCSACRRSMGGLGMRCKYCGWVDGSRFVYVFLVVLLVATCAGAFIYVTSSPGGGGADIKWAPKMH